MLLDLASAVLLAIILEGLLYAAFPVAMKRAIELVLKSPTGQIRVIGLVTAAVALIVLFWVRSG
ncbi:MAG: DUF2065 domain-containing protein [Alphaproteobacteria bacterium]|nr:DUF2065 domain-containing protein [Alphaproteobacteria bacterium]